MSTILDTDYFIINRDDQSYKVSAQDVKNQLGGSYAGEGRFDTPVQVLSPPNGSGISQAATYQPFTTPTLEDLSPQSPDSFFPKFSSEETMLGLTAPVTQCGPDGEDYKAQIGEVLSVTQTDHSGLFQYTGSIQEGTVESMFDGNSQSGLRLGPNAEFDFTDCNLPIPYNSSIWYYAFDGLESTYVQVTYSDGTVEDVGWSRSSSKRDATTKLGKSVLKLTLVGGNSGSYLYIYGIRVDDPSGALGAEGGNYIRDGLYQLNFAEGSNELRFSVYGQYVNPRNEQVAYAGYQMNSLVLWSENADAPTATAFVAGDIVEGPALIASATTYMAELNNLRAQISGITGYWFVGLSVKGASITASAPSAESVEFTSMNFNTTPVTGTNVSLTNRRWSLESSSSETGPWSVVGSYDDDSANFTQNGIDKWEGRPTLQSNTYYRVKVRYDSGNAPSVESALNYFKTA